MEKDFLALLGEKISALRNEKGMSVSELAVLAETTSETIDYIEKGEVDSTAAELVRITTALGVPLKDLIPE